MKKQTLNTKAPYDLSDWKYNVSINQIKSDIIELEKIGVTDIEIDIDFSYGGSYIKIEPIINRLETDKEYNDRINKEKNIEKEIERKELEQLAKLKLKYENPNHHN